MERAYPLLGLAESKPQGLRGKMCKHTPTNTHKALLQRTTGLPGRNTEFPALTPGTRCSEFSELVKIQLSNSLKVPLNKIPSQK